MDRNRVRPRVDLEAPQRGTPRGYRSHLAYDLVPKGARYIVAIETFAREAFVRRGARRDYWHHLASWWPHRNDENVLLLCYEQMNRDMTTTIRRVAAFAGIALDDALLDIVRRQSSIEFMLAHKDRFDDRMMRDRSERVGELPPRSDSAKVRKGKVGEHTTELSPEISAEIDRVWTEDIGSKFGFANYAAMADAV